MAADADFVLDDRVFVKPEHRRSQLLVCYRGHLLGARIRSLF
jgi:hypothetical protein